MPVNALLRRVEKGEVAGAERLAKEGLEALKEHIHRSKATTTKELLKELEHARKQMETGMFAEPCLRNGLKYIFFDLGTKDFVTLTQELCERIDAVIAYFDKVHSKIAANALTHLPDGARVLIHSYSSTVFSVLSHAKSRDKRTTVLLTEGRPALGGRKMATELNRLKIPVTLFVDAAAKVAVKQADIVLLGCDALTPHEVFVDVGGELLALLAHKYDIPVYVCANSWKFDPFHLGKDGKMTDRPGKEVWENPPIGVRISNLRYEKMEPALVKGVVSELGSLPYEEFIVKVKETYPWVAKH